MCRIDTSTTRREKNLVKLCIKWVHGDGPCELCKMMGPETAPERTRRQLVSNLPTILRTRTTIGGGRPLDLEQHNVGVVQKRVQKLH